MIRQKIPLMRVHASWYIEALAELEHDNAVSLSREEVMRKDLELALADAAAAEVLAKMQ